LSPPELPIKDGEIFVEESYRKGEEVLRNFSWRRGYAHVTTARRAEVNLDQDKATVWYQADPGPLTVFGETTVQERIRWILKSFCESWLINRVKSFRQQNC